MMAMCATIGSMPTAGQTSNAEDSGRADSTPTTFLEDCLSLAHRRGLSVAAALPREGQKPIVLRGAVPHQGGLPWADMADQFAIRWRATWEVVDDWLLIGAQYAVPGCSRSHLASLADEDEAIVSFIEGLSTEQWDSLNQDERRCLPLASLTEDQCTTLAGTLLVPGAPPALSPQTVGFVSVRLHPSLWIFSNGRLMGSIGGVQPDRTVYEPVRLNESMFAAPPSLPPEPGLPLAVPGDRLSIESYARAVASAAGVRPAAIPNRRVAQSRTILYVGAGAMPFPVAWQFAIRSLDLTFGRRKQVGAWEVGCARTLPSEWVEKRNLTLLRRARDRIRRLWEIPTFYSEGMRQLWEADPQFFLSGRSRFRVELSQPFLSRLMALDTDIAATVCGLPKVAVSPPFGVILLLQLPDKPRGARRAAGALGLPLPFPMETCAFR